jgi:hypothetical protein
VYSSDSREVQVQAVQVQTRGTQPIRFSKMFFFLDDFGRLDKPE